MKQIIEVGNLANFLNNCEEAFVAFSKTIKVLENYDEYNKYTNLIYVGNHTQFALLDNGKKNVVVKRVEYNDDTEYSVVKFERGLFGTVEMHNLKVTRLKEIKKEQDEELRLELENRAKQIKTSKSVFNKNINRYKDAFYQMMVTSNNNAEYITEITDEENQNPTAFFKVVLPPLNNKGGKITINIVKFTPMGNIFAIFEPLGHPNDTIFNLKTQYIEQFKKILNEKNVKH